MPTFIQFGGPAGAIINIKHLTGLLYGERVATSYDAERNKAEGWPEVGQIIYYISYSVVGGSSTQIDFVSKQYRDNCYAEIVAMIRPVTIGAVPPANAKVPTFETPPEVTEPEQRDKQPIPPAPSEKPPRKPYTRKPKP